MPIKHTPDAYPRIHWYHSLIFRVIVLCAILVLCLLAAVYVITRHYFREVVNEMETETREIAQSIQVQVEANPTRDLADLKKTFEDGYKKIEFEKLDGSVVAPPVTIEVAQNGTLEKVARMVFTLADQRILLTVRVPMVPGAEILRAFRNRYMLLITTVFLVALGFVVYFIGRILRPLRDLSESCAQISEGHLRDVAVRKNSGEILALERTFNDMVAALRDKELVEANLRRAQRLSAIGTLAAGIAHDVRNPLNAIKLLSSHTIDMLSEAHGGDAAMKQLQTIRTEVNRLEEIVSGFLSLAKERELQLESCRIDNLLEECARLIGKDAETRGVHLVKELRAGDAALSLDPKQTKRAVLNVLINAMEATPEGGRVRLFSRTTDTVCEIEIRDDGPGLSNEVRQRAFDPYFTTKPTGTGLGLSITRGIIEEQGGAIELHTQLNQGCQVLITFPLESRAK